MSSQTITLPTGSMWADTPIYSVDGTLQFGLMVTAILPDSTDQSYTITQQSENNLQGIASSLYGNPQLWWTIAELNNMVDPLADAPAGTILRVATLSRINALLSQS